MEIIAVTVVLYLLEPLGAVLFVLLTGFSLYNPADIWYIMLAFVFLGIVKRMMERGK